MLRNFWNNQNTLSQDETTINDVERISFFDYANAANNGKKSVTKYEFPEADNYMMERKQASFWKYIWNGEKKAFMGRNAKNWGEYVLCIKNL